MVIKNGVLINVTQSEANGHFVIPNGVTIIGGWAFACCANLTGITIPSTVISIGFRAFRDCPSLRSISIPDSVKSIGIEAFCNCSGLTSVTIGNGVTRIEDYAFLGCTCLKSKTANYKAFEITPSGKLKCQNKIYEEGRRSFVKGELALCNNGIHYCTNLFEIFNYYAGELSKDIAIYKCDVSEENVGEEGTSKRCAKWLVPRKRLYREDVIRILNGEE